MPEELNRIVTDALSDLLFAPRPTRWKIWSGRIEPAKIHLVGNSMIDSLRRHLAAARVRRRRRAGVEPGRYAVATLRPSNVDDPEELAAILGALPRARRMTVIFPAHPRTAARIASLARAPETPDGAPGLVVTEPLGYLDFKGALDSARLVITDSGGIQEETTALGVPCLTLRAAGRPITIAEGTNRLIGSDPGAILPAAEEVPRGTSRSPPAAALGRPRRGTHRGDRRLVRRAGVRRKRGRKALPRRFDRGAVGPVKYKAGLICLFRMGPRPPGPL